MGEAAQATGAPRPVRYNGETYQLAPLSIPDLGLFEVWLEDRAYRKVERQRDRLDPVTYQERIDAVTRAVGADQFAYGSEAYGEAVRSEAGARHLFYLALRLNHPDMTEELAAKIWDSDVAANAAKTKAQNADPNSPAPAETTPSAES